MNTETEQQELDFGDPLAMERESILVHMVVTEIATPLATAFATMQASGLLSTRFTCYEETVTLILKRHVIDFRAHAINIPALVERIWRAARVK